MSLAYHAPRIEPATVFGEITAAGNTIIITVTGDPYQQRWAITELAKMTPLGEFEKYHGHAMEIPLTWPAVMQLACTFGVNWSPGGKLKEWIVAEIARRTLWHDRELRYPLPPGLALREWQPESVRNIAHLGCLLDDEPRLGKTVSTIVGLAERMCWPEYPAVLPIIVISPKSVVTAWVRHFLEWTPHLKVTAWRGLPDNRRLMVGRYDVYVTSYGTAINDARHSVPIRDAPLLRINPHTVVVDEYHWCNNPDAKRTKAMQRIARKAATKGGLVVPLSATPFLDDFTGTAPTLEVFEYGAFPSKERIADRYVSRYQGDYGTTVTKLNPRNEPELRAAFLGRQLRRTQQDVAPWLSKKTYSTRYVELPARYAKMYQDMEDRMIAEVDSGDEVTPMSTITKIQRLQQLAASACSLHCTYTTDEATGLEIEHQHLTPIMPSWKIEALLEVLAELRNPAIAFTVSKPLAELAGRAAEAEGATVGYIIGGQSDRARDAYVDAFQSGKLDLLCVVCAAGGTGLTLNRAAHEVFLSRPYSLVDAVQAENRGVGDRYPTLDIVDIYATVNDKPTIDQRIRDILYTKAGKMSEYLQDPRIVRELFGGQRRPKPPKRKETAA